MFEKPVVLDTSVFRPKIIIKIYILEKRLVVRNMERRLVPPLYSSDTRQVPCVPSQTPDRGRQ